MELIKDYDVLNMYYPHKDNMMEDVSSGKLVIMGS